MVCTTLSKVDKAGTLSTEVPTAQVLVARSGSKASDDNLTGDDPDLLNFTTAESGIVCPMRSWLQMCYPDLGNRTV
jgi:hypothetical protein